MEVVASDRPGLLSAISKVMADCKVQLQNAKVSTLGERVEDIFFITDEDGMPLASEEKRRCLKGRVIEALSG